MDHLSDRVKTQIAINATEGAAHTDDINGAVVDTAGFRGLRACCVFGAITGSAVTSIKLQQGAAANLSDGADLAGSKITVADDDDGKMFIIDVQCLQERYARLVVDRGTQNAVVQLAWYELYDPAEVPIAQHADVKDIEKHVNLAEGTA